MNYFMPGQRVWYEHQGGWGGGETIRALAVVKAIREKKVTIVVYDRRANCVKTLVVTTGKLIQRDHKSAIDNELSAALFAPTHDESEADNAF